MLIQIQITVVSQKTDPTHPVHVLQGPVNARLHDRGDGPVSQRWRPDHAWSQLLRLYFQVRQGIWSNRLVFACLKTV